MAGRGADYNPNLTNAIAASALEMQRSFTILSSTAATFTTGTLSNLTWRGPTPVMTIVDEALDTTEVTEDPVEIPVEPEVTPDMPLTELLAAAERVHQERLAREQEVAEHEAQVKAWMIKFTVDSWDAANKASLCPTWEQYTNNVGIPGRPANVRASGYTVISGVIRLDISAKKIAEALGTNSDDARVKAMIDALPDDQRFTLYPKAFEVLVSKAFHSEEDLAKWDVFDPDGHKGVTKCICPEMREKYEAEARRNYTTRVLGVQDIVVDGCTAATHI